MTARTVRRRLRWQALWNGNLEPALGVVLGDRDHIVRWAWRTHPDTAERITALDQRLPELPSVRLTGHHQARARAAWSCRDTWAEAFCFR